MSNREARSSTWRPDGKASLSNLIFSAVGRTDGRTDVDRHTFNVRVSLFIEICQSCAKYVSPSPSKASYPFFSPACRTSRQGLPTGGGKRTDVASFVRSSVVDVGIRWCVPVRYKMFVKLAGQPVLRLLDGTISIQHVPVIVRVQCTSQDSNSIQGLRFLSPWMPGWILICRYADRSISEKN